MKDEKEEIVIEVGEWCNRVVSDENGVWLHFDKELLGGVVEYLEGLRDGC